MEPTEVADTAAVDLSWIAPHHRAKPAVALARIAAICQQVPDLFGAMAAVQSTHQGLPRELLARAIKQHRRDTDIYSHADVGGMLAALWNGGREGFEAVQRTRKTSQRAAISAALPWGRD
jgi:hypothetical protein